MSSSSTSNCLYTNAECAQAWREMVEVAGPVMPPAGEVARSRIEMAHVHCFLINYLDSVWDGAEECKGDETNFLQYTRFALQELDHHHKMEEKIAFPTMRAAGVQGLDENIAEHAILHVPLEDLFAYINTFSAAPNSVHSSPAPLSSFSAVHLKDLLDKLLLAVVPHLRHELETLTVDKLVPYMKREDLIAMDKVLLKHILARPAGETLPGESPLCFFFVFLVCTG